ncbi:hypothetical protein [Halorubrum sp. DTA98]|uniref:hypothetical protein n=1 Tax=Halorubrum sp. DTA98 TaxID=3402163 RepID=UPI003AAC0F82
MAFVTETIDREHDFVQLLTKEAVKAGLESPLRDSILEAVEEEASSAVETASEDDTSETKEKSRLIKVIQGGTVFIVMFVVLYVMLRRLTSD